MTDTTTRRLFTDVLRLASVAALFAGAFVLYRRLGLSVGWSLVFAMMVVPVAVEIAGALWRLVAHRPAIARSPRLGD